jgi:hypothetical protein
MTKFIHEQGSEVLKEKLMLDSQLIKSDFISSALMQPNRLPVKVFNSEKLTNDYS